MSKSAGMSLDEQWAWSAYENVRSTEEEHSVEVFVALIPDKVKGIWQVRVGAFDRARPVDDATPIAEFTGRWPNSRTTSLTAYLFACVGQLERMIYGVRGQFDERP